MFDQGAGDGDALFLASGDADAALAYFGLIAIREGGDLVGQLSAVYSQSVLIIGGVGTANRTLSWIVPLKSTGS